MLERLPITERPPVDMVKVRRMLAMLTEMTRETGYIVGTDGEIFTAMSGCDSVFTVRENGGYGLFVVRWDRDKRAYWVEDNAPRLRIFGDAD